MILKIVSTESEEIVDIPAVASFINDVALKAEVDHLESIEFHIDSCDSAIAAGDDYGVASFNYRVEGDKLFFTLIIKSFLTKCIFRLIFSEDLDSETKEQVGLEIKGHIYHELMHMRDYKLRFSCNQLYEIYPISDMTSVYLQKLGYAWTEFYAYFETSNENTIDTHTESELKTLDALLKNKAEKVKFESEYTNQEIQCIAKQVSQTLYYFSKIFAGKQMSCLCDINNDEAYLILKQVGELLLEIYNDCFKRNLFLEKFHIVKKLYQYYGLAM